MNRTPPANIRRQLRTEAHFVCAVPGCTSPYLTYHHFDPPWRKKQHHDPEGMVALCEHHHREADVGTYTREQLRRFKEQAAATPVRGRFNWRREKTVIHVGSCLMVSNGVLLYSTDRNIVWFSKSADGYDLLNLDLFRPNGTLLFCMRDNDWIVLPPASDFEAVPSGHSVDVRSDRNGAKLKLTFRRFQWGNLRKLVGSAGVWEAAVGEALHLVAGEEVQLCDLTAKMRYPCYFHITPNRVKAGHATFYELFLEHASIGVIKKDGKVSVVITG